MGVIYLRTNLINGKQYVGQTKDFTKREYDWKCLKGFYSNQRLQEDREKYGLENWSVKILEECDDSRMNELERFWIGQLNTIAPNGYNKNEGGVGGFHQSEEFKQQVSQKTKGVPKSKEHKTKISKALKGRVPMAAVIAHAENSGQKTYQYTLDDEFVAEYPNMREASRKTKIAFGSIRECCNGGFYSKSRGKWVNRYQAGNFKWSHTPLHIKKD